MTEDRSSFWAPIREDRSRGSSELTRAALRHLREYLSEAGPLRDDALLSLVESLQSVRPEMSLLVNSGYLLEDALEQADSTETCEVLSKKIESLEERLREAPRRMADHLDTLDPSFSHPLLFSRSGTVLDLIQHRSDLEAVSVLESRPGEEGIDVANSLSEGVDVTFYYDLEAIQAFEPATGLLLGADTFREDGYFRNKTGTHLLARACEGIPVICCFQTLKYDPSDSPVSGPSIESPEELADDLIRSHPLFEWVPPTVVDWFVTEQGAVAALEELQAQLKELRTFRR